METQWYSYELIYIPGRNIYTDSYVLKHQVVFPTINARNELIYMAFIFHMPYNNKMRNDYAVNVRYENK